MRGIIIAQDKGVYLVSGSDGRRYQFAIWDWQGKDSPKIGEDVDFVCEGGAVNSVFPLFQNRPEQLKMMLAVVCWLTGLFGVHRFIVGRIWTGVLMLILSLSVVGLLISGPWTIIDFVFIVAGRFKDKSGNRIIS